MCSLLVTAQDFCSSNIYISFLLASHSFILQLRISFNSSPRGQVQAWAGSPLRSSPGLGWHSLVVKSGPGAELTFP